MESASRAQLLGALSVRRRTDFQFLSLARARKFLRKFLIAIESLFRDFLEKWRQMVSRQSEKLPQKALKSLQN